MAVRSRMRTSASRRRQPLGQAVLVALVVGPDRHLVTVEGPEALERAERVAVVVEHRDAHGLTCITLVFDCREPPGCRWCGPGRYGPSWGK